MMCCVFVELCVITRLVWAGPLITGLATPIMPNLPTSIVPTNIAWLKLSGNSPMGLRIPPLRIMTMLESNPLKSTMLVGRLGVSAPRVESKRRACAHPHADLRPRAVCMYVYIYIYIYISIQREREREGERDVYTHSYYIMLYHSVV